MDTDVDLAIEDVKLARTEAQRATERFDAAVDAAYRAGASLRRLAEALGMTVEGVRQALVRRGVDIRPPHVR